MLTIGEAFLGTAAANGGRPAIVDADGSCNYAELAENALAAAAGFAAADAPSLPVAIALPRGRAMVAAMLGAAMAQRPWSVLSRLDAPAQVRRQLQAIGTCDVIGDDTASLLAAADGLPVRIAPDARRASALQTAPALLAALCFTSGSTGEPKGVALRHDATVHNAGVAFRSLGLTPDDRYLWLAAPGSAATCTAVFATLLNGACLLPFEAATEGFAALGAAARARQATVLHTIPALFRRLLRSTPANGDLASLRIVKLGGEAVFPADVALFRERLSASARLVNGLGLSEANGNVCHEAVAPDESFDEQVPIGRALPGVTLSVRNEAGDVAPSRVTGRLWIEGAWLAEGYWDSALSRAEPFPAASPGSDRRLFRSHDRCLALPDGRLVYRGRTDGIVKIRGVRVSLAGVEARLRDLPGVADAVVDATGTEPALAAWIEPAAGTVPTVAAIRAGLQARLPPEAVPARIDIVAALPLLPGGKLDRRALLADAAPAANAAAAALDRIAALFAAAVGRKCFGMDEDFFEAGGDSLAAMSLAAALEAELGRDFPPSRLVACATPARVLAGFSSDDVGPAVRLAGTGPELPLWLVAGAGVSVFHLMPLARALGRVAPVYGFEAGHDHAGRATTSVTAMTGPMYAAIRRLQPDGPYLLAGNSFGGWLALDLAQRLQADGERVAFLGMLDAGGPGYPAIAAVASLSQRRQHHEAALFGDYSTGSGGPLGRRWQALRRRIGARTHVRAGTRLDTLPPLIRLNVLKEACLLAKQLHPPRRFQGQITVFHAEQSEAYCSDPTMGWTTCTDRPVAGVPVPGTHATHMQPPHVAQLAKLVAAAIDRELPWTEVAQEAAA